MPCKPSAVLSLIGLALVLPASVLAGENENGGFAPVDPVSPNAQGITDTYYIIAALAGLILLLVVVPLLVFMVRYRARGRPRELEGPQVRGNNRLELTWTVVPVVLLVAILGFVFYKLPGINDLQRASASDRGLEIAVEGRQYYWQYTYPNGVIAVNSFRVPQGRTVKLEIRSPDDGVQHSFWIPAFGGKYDALPGHANRLSFRASKTGVYRGNCGEFCGLQHSVMYTSALVLPPRAFDRWLAGEARRQRTGTSNLGQISYSGACATCHGPEGNGLIGPSIKGNPIAMDAEAIERLTRNGRGEMPPVAAGWTDRQMRALVRYLRREIAPGERNGDGG